MREALTFANTLTIQLIGLSGEPEALAKAKAENKPLIISIGYASCHWCHVMERESFMDTAVARIMNENFVCYKDRSGGTS